DTHIAATGGGDLAHEIGEASDPPDRFVDAVTRAGGDPGVLLGSRGREPVFGQVVVGERHLWMSGEQVPEHVRVVAGDLPQFGIDVVAHQKAHTSHDAAQATAPFCGRVAV